MTKPISINVVNGVVLTMQYEVAHDVLLQLLSELGYSAAIVRQMLVKQLTAQPSEVWITKNDLTAFAEGKEKLAARVWTQILAHGDQHGMVVETAQGNPWVGLSQWHPLGDTARVELNSFLKGANGRNGVDGLINTYHRQKGKGANELLAAFAAHLRER